MHFICFYLYPSWYTMKMVCHLSCFDECCHIFVACSVGRCDNTSFIVTMPMGRKIWWQVKMLNLLTHTGLFPYFLREFTWKIASIPIQYFPRDFSFAFIKIFPRKGNPILTHNIFYLEAVWIACRKRDEFSFSVSHNRCFTNSPQYNNTNIILPTSF